MNGKRLSPDFAVAPQISPADMLATAAQGFRAITCNRPDGEDAAKPGAFTPAEG